MESRSDGYVALGIFQNANYLVEQRNVKLVFRFYSTGLETASREVSILP